MKRLIERMARSRRGLMVLTGVTALLSGVECVLSAGLPPRHKRVSVSASPAPARPLQPRCEHRFTIRQTRSEFGYVYWVLQGFGDFQSFTLFDTWAEAMAEAERRIEAARLLQSQQQPAEIVYA